MQTSRSRPARRRAKPKRHPVVDGVDDFMSSLAGRAGPARSGEPGPNSAALPPARPPRRRRRSPRWQVDVSSRASSQARPCRHLARGRAGADQGDRHRPRRPPRAAPGRSARWSSAHEYDQCIASSATWRGRSPMPAHDATLEARRDAHGCGEIPGTLPSIPPRRAPPPPRRRGRRRTVPS